MSSAVGNTVSYGRPENKQETERIERMKREQAERAELRRQQRQPPALTSQQTHS